MDALKFEVGNDPPLRLTEPVQFGSWGVLVATHVFASVTDHVSVVADPRSIEVCAAESVTVGWIEVTLTRIALMIVSPPGPAHLNV